MTAPFEEISTITVKGQTTVPKAVRQALGVGYGGKIAFRIENGKVTLSKLEVPHHDPALGHFLNILAQDIHAGRHMSDMPAGVMAALKRALAQAPVELDETLDGDVAL